MKYLYNFIDLILPFEWLSPIFMKNAFIALLIASPIFGMLGNIVVSNRMAFFSDAIGHSALTGIALGAIFGIARPTIAMVLFSIFLGYTIITVKIKGKTSSDTIIGVFSSSAVALGIVLLSARGNFSKYQKYLVGDILSIQTSEIFILLCLVIILIIIWSFFYNKMLIVNIHENLAKSRGINTFAIEQLFALVTAIIVTISIQWTGLLVINSLLVLPAASARMISKNASRYFFLSILFSFISSIAGLSFSYYASSASGASIVLVNTIIFVLCLIIRNIKTR